MRAKWLIPFIVVYCVFISSISSVMAQEVAGNTYYCISLDVRTAMPQHFNLAFSGSSGSSDNATSESDNGTQDGTITVSVDGVNFDNATGTYLMTNGIFNATWEAASAEKSTYYNETIYTYYSYFVVGLSFLNNFFTAGVVTSTVTEVSEAKGTVKDSGVAPFVGILISSG